jgi:hypothetical protein
MKSLGFVASKINLIRARLKLAEQTAKVWEAHWWNATPDATNRGKRPRVLWPLPRPGDPEGVGSWVRSTDARRMPDVLWLRMIGSDFATIIIEEFELFIAAKLERASEDRARRACSGTA